MINQEEYEVLKALDSRAKSIVRQARGWLWVAEQPIIKDETGWYVEDGFDAVLEDDNLFHFIQWEDREPYNIAELIKEYEDKGDVGYTLKEFAESLSEFNEKKLTESEKEMKKDKDWLSEQVGDLNSTHAVFNESGVSYIDTVVSMERVYELIDQLDEPEVLSQEWIDEHKVSRINNLRKMTMSDVVPVDKLQNILVPKQELPVIPKYVADWIEKKRESYKSSFLSLGYELYANNISDSEINIWMTMNQNTFARAWLDGYKIEEEPKYYVLDKNELPLLIKLVSNSYVRRANTYYTIKETNDSKFYQLTEQEIKDYDERFWAFAVPAEEVAECYKEQTDLK